MGSEEHCGEIIEGKGGGGEAVSHNVVGANGGRWDESWGMGCLVGLGCWNGVSINHSG